MKQDTYLIVRQALAGISRAPMDEKVLQDQMEKLFSAAGLDFERECLTETGPVDFRVGKAAVEVKVHGSALAVTRQLARYLDDPRFDEGIIVTTRPMQLIVREIHAEKVKPIRMVELWRQFF